jgi:hypothetical protein
MTMYGVYSDHPKSISLSFAVDAQDEQRDALLQLIKGVEKAVSGKENDCSYECSIQRDERIIAIEAEKDSFVYQGPWRAEYSVITDDVWADGSSLVAFVCRNVWGPRETGKLFDDEAKIILDLIDQRLQKVIGCLKSSNSSVWC